MLIAEIFQSIQGEGKFVGMPSVFIRTSGCNLRCNWCDTMYASWYPEGEERAIASIVDIVASYSSDHVVITGGEPMIAKGIHELCRALRKLEKFITIETAGTVPPDGVECDLASLSPKLSNATPDSRLPEEWRRRHEDLRFQPAVIKAWVNEYRSQIKFVVSKQADLKEIQDWLRLLEFRIQTDHIFLMPEGVTTDSLALKHDFIIEACKSFGYRFGPRLHIELFGNTKGT